MKSDWQTEKIDKILSYIIFGIVVMFCCLFYISEQYWISFLTLGLMLIFYRIKDLKNLTISAKGLFAEFIKSNEKIPEIIKSDKPAEEKIEEVQKLIDEVFKLGYQTGGGRPFNEICNVKIHRDEKGNITGVQYNEN